MPLLRDLPRRALRTRRPIALLVALLVAPGAIGLDATAADAAPAPGNRIELTASAVHAKPGAAVMLHGQVYGRLPKTGHRQIEVQQRVHGAGRWRVADVVALQKGGTVSIATRPLTRSRDFRLRLRLSSSTSMSGPLTVVVPTALTVTATSPLTPAAGEAVVLAGRASTQLAGSRIRLQRLAADGLWKTVSSSQIAADATFNVQAVATEGGEQSYRVATAAAPGVPAATSDATEFTVYAWYRLADLPAATPPHAADRPLVPGPRTIAGVPFEQSLSADALDGQSTGGAYSLDGRCTMVRATVGPAPGSTGISRFRLMADDDVAATASPQPEQSEALQGSIAGAEVLELRSFQLTGPGTPAWGSPEVFCAGTP